MGTSGFVLKKKENADFEKLIFDVKTAAYQACLISHIESKIQSWHGEVWVEGNIANTFDEVPGAQQWMMYINADVKDDGYDWLMKEDVFGAIIFDRIGDCEEILLDFLYEYFRRNPEDYFWCGGYSWYFTFDDIARIKQREFAPDWCYKDPHLNEEKLFLKVCEN